MGVEKEGKKSSEEGGDLQIENQSNMLRRVGRAGLFHSFNSQPAGVLGEQNVAPKFETERQPGLGLPFKHLQESIML